MGNPNPGPSGPVPRGRLVPGGPGQAPGQADPRAGPGQSGRADPGPTYTEPRPCVKYILVIMTLPCLQVRHHLDHVILFIDAMNTVP